MKIDIDNLEIKRLEIQANLDALKSSKERNILGQYSTPTNLARDIIEFGTNILSKKSKIKFLDPAIGTGTFFSALISKIPLPKIQQAEGFEIDAHYSIPSIKLWSNTNLIIHPDDFTKSSPPSNKDKLFNFVVCNPPYVRHHHIDSNDKKRLQFLTESLIDIKTQGLAGLYCYFVLLAHQWMEENGIACWLIPSEFMDVNYGKMLKNYFLNKVKLIRIHRFEPNDVQFTDALVSSAIIFFKKEKPCHNGFVEFSYGGKLNKPNLLKQISINDLHNETKWSRYPKLSKRNTNHTIKFSDIFSIKRGIATGDNKFFIFTHDKIKELKLPFSLFTPVLPGPRYLNINEIEAEKNGDPKIEHKFYLLNCNLSEDKIKTEYPTLFNYLQSGKPEVSERYICKNRSPWYKQELRKPSPFICTYLGRSNDNNNNPFRFILNHSKAIATNVYLLIYLKPELENFCSNNTNAIHKIWEYFNTLKPESLIEEGRVYGGGLYKIEPLELSKVNISSIINVIPEYFQLYSLNQLNLF